jgi:uncharacterized protein
MLKHSLLAVCAAVMLSSLAQAAITVTGTGKIKYTPDLGFVHLGISSEDKSAADAWKNNANKVKKIFEALKAMGIDVKDIQTTGVNVSPKYFYPKDEPPRLLGYVASYDLTVKVRKLNEVGKVLDGAVEAGANRSVGISFGSSEADKLVKQARLAAVTEAREKAKLLVEGAGAALGLVRSINEGNPSSHYQRRFDMPAKGEMDVSSLIIAAGEQEMSVTVTLVYDITHATK